MKLTKENIVEYAKKRKEQIFEDTKNNLLLINEFQRNNGLGRIKQLKLNEYAVGFNNKSFCNWVETETLAISDIRGGTSGDFGVYWGKNNTWKNKNNKEISLQEAEMIFSQIKTNIFDIYNSANRDNFKHIDELEMPTLRVKSKILFLYHPQKIIPIHQKEAISKLCNIFDVEYDDNYPIHSNHLLLTSLRKIGYFDDWRTDQLSRLLYPKEKYWLFIVPKTVEYGTKELWEYCMDNSIAAMQYQTEHETQGPVTKNINQIKKITLGDKVIVYLNDKVIGNIGEVEKEFYQDITKDNGFDGYYGQRIGLKWIYSHFKKQIPQINEILTKPLGSQTIHSIKKEQYQKITNLFSLGERTNTNTSKNNNLLNKKNQIILYGPPGTGKTYNTKRISVEMLKK